jgi:hypothetical protein
MPFPSSAYNINVLGTGVAQGGNNLQGQTISKLGTMPPQTGMPVFFSNYPISPKRYIQQIDQNTGLVTVAISGAAGEQLYQRSNPWEVNIMLSDAKPYAWPTGAGCIPYQANSVFTAPTSTVRGESFLPGTGLIYG